MRTRLPYAAAAVVLLLVAAVPEPSPEPPAGPLDFCGGVDCEGSIAFEGGTIVGIPGRQRPAETSPPPVANAPLPIDLATDGKPCADGPRRPSVGTTKVVTLSVNFVAAPGAQPTGATFEYQALGEPDSVYGQTSMDGPKLRATLEFEPGELGPGDSYRWRVRGTEVDTGPGWSGWCEFTVAADAPDLRELDPPEIEAITELGLRPERRYAIRLAGADWRKVREPFEFDPDSAGVAEEPGSSEVEARQRLQRVAKAVRPDASGRLTLTGAQWATVEVQLAGWTVIVQFGNDEVEPEHQTDVSAYWKVVDRISAQLGGPRHPKLGVR